MTQKMKGIVEGMLSLFDFTSAETDARMVRLRRIRREFANRSDADALRGDWEKVGGDLFSAMQKYRMKHEQRP